MIAQDSGRTVLDHVTSGNSTLSPAVFSSAAQRLLRDGTGRARPNGRRVNRAAFLALATQKRPPPDKAPENLPHADTVGGTELEKALELPDVDGRDLEAIVRKFEGRPIDSRSLNEFNNVEVELLRRDCTNPDLQSLRPIVDSDPKFVFEREMILGAIAQCMGTFFHNYRETGLDTAAPLPPPPDNQAVVDIGGLATAVGNAIDPTQARPPALVRIGSTINIDISGLAPPEAPIGLDYPTWTLINRHEPEWLLPGGKGIPNNSIVPLQTNPTFVDAFMVGINTQFLSEMRWRNLPAPRVSTPLRMFWGYADHASDTRTPDIKPVAEWPGIAPGAADADDVGDLSHQFAAPGDTGGRADLVIAFRTSLFRRYPGTLVYLVDAGGGDPDTLLKGPPHFDAAAGPGQPRYLLPVFRGRIEPDLVFFAFDVPPGDLERYWLVLDEPPMELRFRSDKAGAAGSSAAFANSTIDTPTRVAIDGRALVARE